MKIIPVTMYLFLEFYIYDIEIYSVHLPSKIIALKMPQINKLFYEYED